jgi:hypothetical protein
MGAEGAEAANLHLAGVAGVAAAVFAHADRFGVDVIVAAGHERRNRRGFALR